MTSLIAVALLIADHLVLHRPLCSRPLIVVHNILIAITYLTTDHDLDRLLDRGRLADHGSFGEAHTPLIAIALERHHNRPLNRN